MSQRETVSVVIAMDEEGNVKRAYYSPDAALIIETANVLRVNFDVTTINATLITGALKPPRVSLVIGDLPEAGSAV